jgi:hypothetical protein
LLEYTIVAVLRSPASTRHRSLPRGCLPSLLVASALLMSEGVTGHVPLPAPSAAGRITLSRRTYAHARTHTCQCDAIRARPHPRDAIRTDLVAPHAAEGEPRALQRKRCTRRHGQGQGAVCSRAGSWVQSQVAISVGARAALLPPRHRHPPVCLLVPRHAVVGLRSYRAAAINRPLSPLQTPDELVALRRSAFAEEVGVC